MFSYVSIASISLNLQLIHGFLGKGHTKNEGESIHVLNMPKNSKQQSIPSIMLIEIKMKSEQILVS